MNLREHWQLNPEIDFLNHGSFGATPTIVLEAQQNLVAELESDPIRFLAPERELEPKLDRVRHVISELVGAPARDLAFVRSATDGVNAVLRSLPLAKGDEIIITDHGYNACNNAARFAAGQSGANVRVANVPFPIADDSEVVEAIEARFSDRTRLLLVDHVTSPTGLIFPLERIIASARSRGIRVLVDGAHAPGMLKIDLRDIGADYYTANHHKWLCAPKASGFLYVHPDLQDEVRPTIISHAANRGRPGRSRFIAEFDWNGTFDPTPLLAVPTAIEFLHSLYPGGLEQLMSANHELALRSRRALCEALEIDSPSPDAMIGSLASVPLPPQIAAEQLGAQLFSEHRIEVPIFPGPRPGTFLLRTSSQAYNCIEQSERLARLLREDA